LINKPELLETIEYGTIVSFEFWVFKNINKIADAGDIDKVTEIINGPKNYGIDERKKFYDEAKEIFK
jgi:predicted chitinase